MAIVDWGSKGRHENQILGNALPHCLFCGDHGLFQRQPVGRAEHTSGNVKWNLQFRLVGINVGFEQQRLGQRQPGQRQFG